MPKTTCTSELISELRGPDGELDARITVKEERFFRDIMDARVAQTRGIATVVDAIANLSAMDAAE